MKNDEIYQQAFTKHQQNELLRTALKRHEFVAKTTCYVRKSKNAVALLVATGEIEDPSDLLEALHRLETIAFGLAAKNTSNIKQSPPWKSPNQQ